MSEPTISIIIPTTGRDTLGFCLQTIAQQKLIDGDEILVIGDGAQKDVEAQIEAIGRPFRYIQGPHTNDWGHTQINVGLGLARADWIAVTDDDDCFFPRSIETVRSIISEGPGKPHLFRFYTNDKILVWKSHDHGRIDETLIGSHNLITPNKHDHIGLGSWTERYRGDFDWVRAVLDAYPKRDWVWRPEILSRQRPDRTLAAWEVRSEEQKTAFQNFKPDTPQGGWPLLFSVRDEPFEYCGWAHLYRVGDRMFVAHGLGESFKGRGLATLVLGHVLDAAMGDCYTNPTTRQNQHVYREAGFVEKDGVLWHEYPPV